MRSGAGAAFAATNIVYHSFRGQTPPKQGSDPCSPSLRPVTQKFQRFLRALFLFQFQDLLSAPVPEPDGRGLLRPGRDAVFRLDQPFSFNDLVYVLFEQIFPGKTGRNIDRLLSDPELLNADTLFEVFLQGDIIFCAAVCDQGVQFIGYIL